jgi:hypothetical protein
MVAASNANLLTLRLADLPRGFRAGDDRGCGDIGVEGASDRLASFVVDERPSGCLAQFEFVWPARPGVPALVESNAIVFEGSDGADRGLDLRDDVLDFTLGLGEVEDEGDVPGLGEEAVAFSTRNALVKGQIGQPGYGVAWRSGNALEIVFQGGLEGDTGRDVALDLARKQQERAEKPTPVTQTETDDREVALDKPGLELPVYWLGRTFDPPGGLPPLELAEAITLGPGDGPGNQVKIDYRGGVTLDLWTPESFKRFKGTRLGLMVWSWPCTDSQEIRLRRGHAVIYAGYSEPAREPCASRPHDRFIAYAYFDDVVVVVDMPYCYSCAARSPADQYNSLAGMEAIVKGLRLRPSSTG